MKIAYLILCHNDSEHISRLVNRLKVDDKADIYIHLDKKISKESFKLNLINNKGVYFIRDRIEVFWGGFSAIEATFKLLELANKNKYDRYILLQGADYPLVSNEEIMRFFDDNKEIEFIRACNISKSKDRYFYSRYKCFWFYDNINFFKKIMHKLNRKLNLAFRNKELLIKGKKYDLYWGCAQWALTNECVEYILDFKKNNKQFDEYFKYIFPADEIYFHTIIFNSNFSLKTTFGGPEKEKRGLVNWRNIHYFEYKGPVKIFTKNDYQTLKDREELFIRKVNSKESKDLLDIIDNIN